MYNYCLHNPYIHFYTIRAALEYNPYGIIDNLEGKGNSFELLRNVRGTRC